VHLHNSVVPLEKIFNGNFYRNLAREIGPENRLYFSIAVDKATTTRDKNVIQLHFCNVSYR